MERNEFQDILKDAVNDAELKSSDIPSIELYVDQIINLHTEKLKEGSTRFYDRQLTKTMINNYAKDRVITPVKGKKYTKEQIIQILTVYTLKGTLSIGEIKRMLHGTCSADKSLVELYDKYTSSKENTREYAQKVVEEMLAENGLRIENDDDFFVAVATISTMSAFMKSIAQAMIDAKYPEAEDESESDKEKKEKDKDKEKKEKEKKEKKDKEKKEKKKKSSDEVSGQEKND